MDVVAVRNLSEAENLRKRTKPIVGGADIPVCSAIEGRAWMVVLVLRSGIFLCFFCFFF